MSIAHNTRSIVTDGLICLLDPSIPNIFTLTEVEVLVVAGGGAGGQDFAGGGGGGGVLYSSSYKVTPGSAITVTIGNGGPRPNTSNAASGNAFNGQNSVFGYLTAIGGGAGGGSASGSATNGGSGGGCGYSQNGINAGTGVSGQGYNGELSNSEPAGGGGAGGSGYKGNGGSGLPFSISGTLTYYGGGGGGANNSYYGIGGLGGGGTTTGYQTGDGTPNTGGGGGGYYGAWTGAGAGGSGIVIVRYKGGQKATGGNTIVVKGGHTIHTFTTSGTFTPTTINTLLGMSDLSPSQHSAIMINTPTYNSSNNGVITFNGATQYMRLPHDALWKNIKNITYDLWFQTAVTNTRQGLISSHENTGGSNQDAIEIEIQANNTSFVGFRSTNGSFYQATYNTTLSTNTWYNLTGVLTDSSIIYYLNGTQVATAAWPGTNVVNAPAATLLLAYYGALHLNGRIGTFKAYNRALTATEVLQNYNALKSRFGLGL